MRIFFDQGVPVPLRKYLVGHDVQTAYEQGWSDLKNGELLDAAEKAGYEIFVTTDQKLKYQQNIANRYLAIVVLLSTSWPRIRGNVDVVRDVIDRSAPGGYEEVPINP